MTGHAFRKCWGAELSDGGTTFRLWAPAMERLCLRDGSGRLHEMARGDDDWFSLTTDAVPVDGDYCFQLADRTRVPDPAARAQVRNVHGPSRLIDPRRFEWRHDWTGRPWEEAVLYELHTGTFSQSGDFDGIRARLDHLAELGVTALEIMPVAQFAGRHGWGYDGVLLYAPHEAYGGPEALKRLVDAAHRHGLMVLLDVVYNHFGPDGNYLPLYAPAFFDESRKTPWGPAIAFRRPPVRRFFIENALYWLEEFRLDGLRFDAVDQIDDVSDEPILEEIATAVRARITDRHIHLTTEDNRNIVSLHPRDAEGRAALYTGEWNDDWHHAAHVVLTGEREGYYADYCGRPVAQLARALTEGFIYQGENSRYLNRPRGEVSIAQPPTAFIDFLQNHDQIGNRALGERLSALAEPRAIEALLSILLLAPHIPLLFMGEEWGATTPFLFFTDFGGELADAVREGRRAEFTDWPAFSDPEQRAHIPDPNSAETFEASKLRWENMPRDGERRLSLVRRLLRLRREHIVPLLDKTRSGEAKLLTETCLRATWPAGADGHLVLYSNLSDTTVALVPPTDSDLIHAYPEDAASAAANGTMLPWSVLWHRAGR